jgi:hypothetical protein
LAGTTNESGAALFTSLLRLVAIQVHRDLTVVGEFDDGIALPR